MFVVSITVQVEIKPAERARGPAFTFIDLSSLRSVGSHEDYVKNTALSHVTKTGVVVVCKYNTHNKFSTSRAFCGGDSGSSVLYLYTVRPIAKSGIKLNPSTDVPIRLANIAAISVCRHRQTSASKSMSHPTFSCSLKHQCKSFCSSEK